MGATKTRPVARIEGFWSTVPLALKPDALSGSNTEVTGGAAGDYCAYLATAIDGLSSANDYAPELAKSAAGASRARAHALAEIAAVDWYTSEVIGVSACQQRLETLRQRCLAQRQIAIDQLVVHSCRALGFSVVLSRDLVLGEPEYQLLYPDRPRQDIEFERRAYLLGSQVRLMLVCGAQTNNALQIMKTFLRFVLRYPDGPKTCRNWLHVSNPNVDNYPELLRMFNGARVALDPGSLVHGEAGAAGKRSGEDTHLAVPQDRR